MKPDVPVALQKLSLTLLTEIGPAIGADYVQRSAAIAALMLQMVAEEWERAAARRAEENTALRELFRGAGAAVADGALRARLEAAGSGADGDLRISALDRGNRELRALLVELHAHVEGQDSPEARRLEGAIWAELRRSTERRALPLAPF
jgi:hypothetical protein